uniref:Uncharacterized protein LOC104247294 n=1 Tax=Nicotiana sylvestris TaxID=4096 RepID=A0A1U7YEK2_NICSY|nr:PREDICTED: uncharacterized protein LOC104247294 [Nicotiana sylvestris]
MRCHFTLTLAHTAAIGLILGQERDLPGLLSKSRECAREKKIQRGLQVLAESYSKQSPHIRVHKATRLLFALFGLVHKARSALTYIIVDPGPYLDYARLHTLAVFIIENNYRDCICSRCLNYVTSLYFVIGTVVTVSCAIPYLFKAQELIAKDNNRFLGPYYTLFHLEPDGILEFDLPMMQLEELFNVYHFIVSQKHPHVASFLQMHEFGRAYGGTCVNDCVDEYLSDYNETFGGKCATYIVLASNHKDKIHKSKRQHKALEFVRTIQAVCVILGMDFYCHCNSLKLD